MICVCGFSPASTACTWVFNSLNCSPTSGLSPGSALSSQLSLTRVSTPRLRPSQLSRSSFQASASARRAASASKASRGPPAPPAGGEPAGSLHECPYGGKQLGGRRRRLRRGEGLLGRLDENGEPLRVAHGDVSQGLAVELDAGLAQAADEPAVVQLVLAGGGVQPHRPQAAELALAGAAMTEGELHRPAHRQPRLPVELRLGEEVALRLPKNLLAPAGALESAFNSWHECCSFLDKTAPYIFLQ